MDAKWRNVTVHCIESCKFAVIYKSSLQDIVNYLFKMQKGHLTYFEKK